MCCWWLGVIFEWEGVIVEDDAELERQAWLTLAQEEGKSPPPAFVLRRVEGMKNEQAISKRITSALENHKYEIADWDLGAGIYIDFYVLKNSMQERNAMDDSGSLEEMSESCRSFFGRLIESLLVWGSKLPVESRACYSKMAEELCALLVDTPSETLNLPMGCLLTMLNAPVPDESRSSYLQDALSVFTEILCSDP
uniref:Nuclear pore complex protein NUP96 n=1 Tax=Zea mays TaxID=4577 RepID=A0A804M1V2_MAIZE